MWIYSQSSGNLWDDSGAIVCKGYSGAGEGKNNPGYEHVKNVGPIPRGLYIIGAPYDSNNVGPFALPLTPTGHEALGRAHFRIHGDSISNPGNASKGCPIFKRTTRTRIYNSNDKILRVIA